jgi:predicted transcriptional regulator
MKPISPMQFNLKYDTAEPGLRAVLKDHQEIALRAIWATPEGLGSKAVWDRVNAELKPNTISRASVINFLEAMREAGVLKGEERTGKGGHRWIYRPAMNESEFKQHVARTILESLLRDFPEETSEAVKKIP